jgi:hypothetical protein
MTCTGSGDCTLHCADGEEPSECGSATTACGGYPLAGRLCKPVTQSKRQSGVASLSRLRLARLQRRVANGDAGAAKGAVEVTAALDFAAAALTAANEQTAEGTTLNRLADRIERTLGGVAFLGAGGGAVATTWTEVAFARHAVCVCLAIVAYSGGIAGAVRVIVVTAAEWRSRQQQDESN